MGAMDRFLPTPSMPLISVLGFQALEIAKDAEIMDPVGVSGI